MIARLSVGLLLASLCAVSSSRAQDVSGLYSRDELARIARIYAPNIEAMWRDDFLSQLTARERLQAGAVTLRLPLFGIHRQLLEFYSSAARREVVLPVSSIKFVDDLAAAAVFYDQRGCGHGPVSDYVAALRFRSSAEAPLDTLGVPASALDDEIAKRIVSSTLFFVMGHEFAHVMYAHRPYESISAVQAQAQEIEADAFALDVMRRISVPALGVVHFFVLASRLEPAAGGVVRLAATHPVSARRIAAIADSIDANVRAFTKLQPDRRAAEASLRARVQLLRGIAGILDDNRMRTFLEDRARNADLSAFRRACRF